MFALVLVSVLRIGLSTATDFVDDYDFSYKPENSIRTVKELFLNHSYFSSLENYHVNGVQVTEVQYPWIARVIHSRSRLIPHMCTAVCIDAAIFITAARCIYTLKVNYTSIIYRSKHLHAMAFVLPTPPTKQGYDDIGFIVVKSRNVKGKWAVIELFSSINRTDNAYRWFANMDFSYGLVNTKVVGYASEKILHKIKVPERQYNLTELNVIVGLELCAKLLTPEVVESSFKGYLVPCYYACTFSQFLRKNEKCFNYHGVEGGAVFDTISNKLLGIATWGSYYHKFELPVGFSFANSEQFYKDYTCARRIRDDNGMLITKGYYQSLCAHI